MNAPIPQLQQDSSFVGVHQSCFISGHILLKVCCKLNKICSSMGETGQNFDAFFQPQSIGLSYYSMPLLVPAGFYFPILIVQMHQLHNLKPLQNKKGQKNLGYPRKKQPFYEEKDCFFSRVPQIFLVLLILKRL